MISIRNLRKEFPGITPLNDITVDINKGDVVSIIGPSGTGKSTFLRCINLLEKPTSGEIFIDGQSITDKKCKVHLLRRKMGMVFQSFNLFGHMNIIENVMSGPVTLLGRSRREAYDRGLELLNLVGLADKALAYPDELSGGQKQRAAIARTLAMDPEIVLFDEPTSALDPTMVGEVLSVIRMLAGQGMTMMIVTHEMKFARDVSTRVFYMDEGGIYEEGTPAEIFDAPKRDKTRRFIMRLKVLEETVTSGCDYPAMITRMEEFGRRYMLPQRTIRNAQLAFEEICVQQLMPWLTDGKKAEMTLECGENGTSADMTIDYDDTGFDPLENADELSMDLIKLASTEMSSVMNEDRGRILIKLKTE